MFLSQSDSEANKLRYFVPFSLNLYIKRIQQAVRRYFQHKSVPHSCQRYDIYNLTVKRYGFSLAYSYDAGTRCFKTADCVQ